LNEVGSTLIIPGVSSLAPRFHALFAGLERAHGRYGTPSEQRENGKLKGKAFTAHEPVTDALWERHLQSDANGIGIIPLRDDGTVLFAAIDLDVYADFDHARMAARLAEMNLPLILCRSKSGGAHLYLFCASPVSAAKVRERLRDIAARIGHGGSEIFPSHDKVTGDDALSYWINAPFAGAASTTRYAIRPNGDAMTAEEFLAAADAAKVGPEWFTSPLPVAASSLPDGPPCLQHLMELGFPPGTWDSGMFNLGVYCKKAHPGNWKENLVQLNAINFPVDKWPVSDLEGIFRSLSKKDYRYQCDKPPLVNHCNQVQCRKRKHGVGGANSLPVLVGMCKLMTDPPVWTVEVEGVRISLTTEELLNPLQFQIKACNHGIVMPVIGRGPWTEHLRPFVASATEIQVADDESEVDDSSPRGVFMELLEDFCVGRAQANSLEELGVGGRPYTFDGHTRFRLTDIMSFLVRKGIKNYTRRDAVTTLKAHGAKNHLERIAGRPTRVWTIKAFSREDVTLTVPDTVPEQGGVLIQVLRFRAV
jgi:TOTE conflict system, Archaeo-Eukaryotic Primase domain